MSQRSQKKSKAAFKAAQQIFPGGVNSPVRAFNGVGGDPFIVKKGEGAYLYDIDSNAYIDYVNSWGPLVLGHAHPKVQEALVQQLQNGTSYGASCELELQLAKFIQEFYPSMQMLRFVNSGTEAGMSVLRLARGYTKRNKVIKFAGCYHGHSDSLLIEAGSGVATLGLPNCAGVPAEFVEHTLSAEFNNLDHVQELFERFPNDIAAVIVEPVMGNAGFIPPEDGFLQSLRDITKQHESLLVFDEVMTGFRVGLTGAQGLYDVEPDLTMLGKVIGGGLPVGAFGGREEIMRELAPLGAVYQAGTLSGNPLAMAAGLATLQEWTRPGVFESVDLAAKTLVQALQELAVSHKIDLRARSLGSMFGLFFCKEEVRNYQDAQATSIELFKKFFHAALSEGVYFAPSAFEAGFVSAAHVGAPLEETLRALEKTFEQLVKG